MERPLRKAEYTIHIEVPPRPFLGFCRVVHRAAPIGSGVQYESRVSWIFKPIVPKCDLWRGPLGQGAVWMESDEL